MSDDLHVRNGITIPSHELEITTSRAGGHGGQHVNKTDSRITVRWNVNNSSALDAVEKSRVLKNLQARLTGDGDLIIHSSESRSQQHNKELALVRMAQIVRQALHVPKKRMATCVPKSVKELRLRAKSYRSKVKKMRSSKDLD